jgi:hypothetical protein
MLPTGGLSDQVTLVLKGRLRTENCCVPEGATDAVVGLTLVAVELGGGVGVGGPIKMVALAALTGSAKLVAEIVTRVSTPTEPGAENTPFVDMVPTPCVTDQVTCWLALPPTDAMNCWDCPPYR